MKTIVIHPEKIDPAQAERIPSLCPFGAIEYRDGELNINAGCRMCGLCVKNGPAGAFEMLEEQQRPQLDKSLWNGVAVFIDYTEGQVHPVSLELLGKARELASVVGHPVQAVLIGCGLRQQAENLLRYPVDELYVYDDPQFSRFDVQPYAAAVADFIGEAHPSALLFGATNAGRSLAPRIAARFKTGLTADCTRLEMKENTDLVQIRPAFGGNIMAQIVTQNTRPQLCTVRYRIFDRPEPGEAAGVIKWRKIDRILSGVEVLTQRSKPRQADISEAELIVALGRGVNAKDIPEMMEFIDAIGAQAACTRPLAEAGLFEPRLQIGLSGRTVKPRLIICAGISGSVQFAAGMNGADTIVAINTDPAAPIFSIAHYSLVGDVREVLPRTLAGLCKKRKERERV